MTEDAHGPEMVSVHRTARYSLPQRNAIMAFLTPESLDCQPAASPQPAGEKETGHNAKSLVTSSWSQNKEGIASKSSHVCALTAGQREEREPQHPRVEVKRRTAHPQ